MERLNYVSSIIDQTNTFIEQVYLPDVAAIGSFYKDWLYGGGLSGKSVLAYGDVPEHANDYSDKSLKLPRGAIINGNLAEIFPVDHRNPEQIQEFVVHSWYKYPDETQGAASLGWRHRAEFPARPQCQGHEDPTSSRSTNPPNIPGSRRRAGAATRWRSGRWRAGSIGYAQNKAEFKEPVDKFLKDLDLPLTALFSTLGPHRGSRARMRNGPARR